MADGLQNSSTGPPTGTGQPRSISIRAVTIGFIFGAGLAAVGYFNDSVLAMPSLALNHMPLAIYGMLILALLTVHPLLRWLAPSLAIRPGEWAVILCITLASGSIAGRGFGRRFVPTLGAPAKHYSTEVTWQRQQLLNYLRDGLILENGLYEEEGPVDEYLNGIPGDDRMIGLGDIPWKAWALPLAFWLPIVCSVLLGALALGVVVHRQWAKRELLKFPIAEFASSLISGRIESAVQVGSTAAPTVSVWRRKGFWVVFGIALGIHLINGFQRWYPTSIQIPLVMHTFWPMVKTWPILGQAGLAWVAYNGWIFLAVVGFSFFLTKEVSLSIGLAPLLHEIFMIVMIGYGINPRSSSDVGMYEGLFNMGVLMGIAWTILWAGRSYYVPLFARAVGISRGPGRPIEGVWAARVFLLACASAVFFLTRVGLPWSFSLVLVLGVMLIQLVIARINAETGLFYYTQLFGPTTILGGMLGLFAIGPQAMLLGGLFAIVVASGSTMQLMPLVINGLEVSRRQNVPTGKVAPWMGAMLVAAILVSVASVLWISYNRGALMAEDNYGVEASKGPFDSASRTIDKLAQEGQLAESLAMSTGQRWLNMKPVKGFLWLVCAGFALTFLFSKLRQRLPWWPLHPVVLAIWGSWPLAWFGFSFLVGWAIRAIVVKLFGERGAQRAKPMMIGLIAGEFVGIFFWLIVGWIYYLITRTPPQIYGVFPG